MHIIKHAIAKEWALITGNWNGQLWPAGDSCKTAHSMCMVISLASSKAPSKKWVFLIPWYGIQGIDGWNRHSLYRVPIKKSTWNETGVMSSFILKVNMFVCNICNSIIVTNRLGCGMKDPTQQLPGLFKCGIITTVQIEMWMWKLYRCTQTCAWHTEWLILAS